MQFGKLLEETYRRCGFQFLRRVATSGTNATVIDTGVANRYGDDQFAQGSKSGYVLFISQTTDRAAPEGQFGEVSAYASSTQTFTVPTMTAVVQSGDIYSLMRPTIPIYEMIGLCNQALRDLPPRERTDTSLTGSSSTLVYTLPSPINRYNIQKIEIGNNTDGWEDAPAWTVDPATGSTADSLRFVGQPPYDATTAANQTFKITYTDIHPTLSVYSDYVEKNIPDELVVAMCSKTAIEYLMNNKPSYFQSKTRMAMYQNIISDEMQARQKHVIRTFPARREHHLDLGNM